MPHPFEVEDAELFNFVLHSLTNNHGRSHHQLTLHFFEEAKFYASKWKLYNNKEGPKNRLFSRVFMLEILEGLYGDRPFIGSLQERATYDAYMSEKKSRRSRSRSRSRSKTPSISRPAPRQRSQDAVDHGVPPRPIVHNVSKLATGSADTHYMVVACFINQTPRPFCVRALRIPVQPRPTDVIEESSGHFNDEIDAARRTKAVSPSVQPRHAPNLVIIQDLGYHCSAKNDLFCANLSGVFERLRRRLGAPRRQGENDITSFVSDESPTGRVIHISIACGFISFGDASAGGGTCFEYMRPIPPSHNTTNDIQSAVRYTASSPTRTERSLDTAAAVQHRRLSAVTLDRKVGSPASERREDASIVEKWMTGRFLTGFMYVRHSSGDNTDPHDKSKGLRIAFCRPGGWDPR